jgi:hypothetical protein
MVLKIQRKWIDDEGKECEAWEFMDKITKCTVDAKQGLHMFGDSAGNISYERAGEFIIAQNIPHAAYLLNDNGQTIERLN